MKIGFDTHLVENGVFHIAHIGKINNACWFGFSLEPSRTSEFFSAKKIFYCDVVHLWPFRILCLEGLNNKLLFEKNLHQVPVEPFHGPYGPLACDT